MNGTVVGVSYSRAAFFFQIAAEQGSEQARNMLRVVSGPSDDIPECMRPPAPTTATAPPNVMPLPQPQIAAPRHMVSLVEKIASEYRVKPALALAVIEAESRFDVAALSARDAKGLMQLRPDTALRFNVRNPYDPAQNIRGGIAYLRWLLAYFEGDVSLVAAAYNAGERHRRSLSRRASVPRDARVRGTHHPIGRAAAVAVRCEGHDPVAATAAHEADAPGVLKRTFMDAQGLSACGRPCRRVTRFHGGAAVPYGRERSLWRCA